MHNEPNKQKNTGVKSLTHAWARILMTVAAFALPIVSLVPAAYASGTASITLSPASGTYTTGQAFSVGVYVNAQASDNANAVEADFTVSGLTVTNVSVSNCPITIPPYGSNYYSGSTIQIPCATSSTYSGSVLIATISAVASAAGSASITATGSSDVDAGGTSIFNGTLPAAHFTISAPVSGGGGTTGGGSSGGSTTKPSGSSSTTNSSPHSGSPTPTPAPQAPPASTTTTPVAAPPTASLTITVTDAHGKPIKGAKVSLDSHYTTYSDANGKAGFSSIASGTHTVVITADGKTTTHQNVVLAADQAKQVSVKLAGSKSPVLVGVFAAAGLLVVGGAGFGYMKLSGRGIGGGIKGPQVSMQGMVVGSDTTPAVRATTPAQAPSTTPTTPLGPTVTVVQPTAPPTADTPVGDDPTTPKS